MGLIKFPVLHSRREICKIGLARDIISSDTGYKFHQTGHLGGESVDNTLLISSLLVIESWLEADRIQHVCVRACVHARACAIEQHMSVLTASGKRYTR